VAHYLRADLDQLVLGGELAPRLPLAPEHPLQRLRARTLTARAMACEPLNSVGTQATRNRRLSMRRRAFISGLLATCSILCASIRPSAAWELVTREEFKRESTAPHNKAAHAAARPGAPIITVEEPNPRRRITPPVTVRVTFRPQDGATIDPRTFRATYGWLGIDITHHIVANAKLSASGLVAKNASVPAGSYRVTLRVADNRHRVGTRTVEFTVHKR
jgi:hypothetical protein